MRKDIFQVVPLVDASFFQKLFKQLPTENSVIELNNLLASCPVKEILNRNIYELKQRYQVNLKQDFKLNLEEFYAVYLNYCLRDGILNDVHFENLDHLKSILSLENDSVEKLNHKIGEIVYRRFFEKAISNGRLIRTEQDFLEKIEKDLQLPKALINKISDESKDNFIQNYVENIIKKRELSPDVELEINNISESLNIDLLFSNEITRKLEKLKLYWKLEHYPLSTIASDIVIQKSEQCYFKIDSVKWYELKSFLQKPSNYTLNINDVKAFYLNSDYKKSNNSNYKYIDSGNLYLTNKRIIFTGRHKDLNIRFEKILRLSPKSDGVEIDKETIKSAFIQFPEKADEFSLILDKLIRER